MGSLWVIVPALNEADNLREIIPRLVAVLTESGQEFRVLVVDDGSTDDTRAALSELGLLLPTVGSLHQRVNKGKAAALRRGFAEAIDNGASRVIMMDADGQDAPHELPRLLQALESGANLVTGARAVRRDRFAKRFTSRLFNKVTGFVSRTPGTDFNSGFKAMDVEVAAALVPTLYGELHRYLTVIAHWRGFAISEVTVEHRPRLHGRSKYGLARFWRGFIDLITIRFLLNYEERPSHLFSAVGALMGVAGAGILFVLLIERLNGQSIGERPLLIAGVLLFLTGLQLVLFGLLAELVVYRTQRAMSRFNDS